MLLGTQTVYPINVIQALRFKNIKYILEKHMIIWFRKTYMSTLSIPQPLCAQIAKYFKSKKIAYLNVQNPGIQKNVY